MLRAVAPPIAFFVALTLVGTYPLSTRPGSEALDLGPDTRLFLWTLAWDVHALVEVPIDIFDANIFHPERGTLAFSEHQIGSALLGAPLLGASGSVLLAMNGILLLSSFLSGLAAFYLGRQLGMSRSAALFTGAVFLLTPPRLFRLGQLHLATVQWIPLCLALLHRYGRGGSRRHLLGAAVVFWIQALSGGQSALFLALAAAGLVVWLAAFGELRPESRPRVDFLLALSLSAALNAPFVLPYLGARSELGLERSLDEAREWSPNAASYLASPAHVHRALLRAVGLERVLTEAKAFLFPGLVPLLFALAALSARGERSPERAPPPREATTAARLLDGAIVVLCLAAVALEATGGVRLSLGGLRISASGGGRAALAAAALLILRVGLLRGRPFALTSLLERAREGARGFFERRCTVPGGYYVALLLLSLWVSLGPDAGLYAALYRLVPGFDFIRVPSRFTLVTVLAVAVLAGFGLERLRSKGARAAFLVLVLVELASFPLPTSPYSVEPSPMDRLLAASPPGPIAVFPIPDPRDTVAAASRHSLYMLHSTAHFLPMVNGYSGFTPPFHDRLFRVLARFPDDEGMSELERIGIRYLVFHRSGYAGAEWRDVVARIEARFDRLELVGSFEEGAVYRLSQTAKAK